MDQAGAGPVSYLVEADDVTVTFRAEEASVNAVNGVSFRLDRDEVLCLLGESGGGKSVTMRALMRLPPRRRARIGGRIAVMYAGRFIDDEAAGRMLLRAALRPGAGPLPRRAAGGGRHRREPHPALRARGGGGRLTASRVRRGFRGMVRMG